MKAPNLSSLFSILLIAAVLIVVFSGITFFLLVAALICFGVGLYKRNRGMMLPSTIYFIGAAFYAIVFFIYPA